MISVFLSDRSWFKEILLLVLGWILGLLSFVISDAIKKRSILKEARKGINSELTVILCQLVTTYYHLSLRSSGINRELIDWVKPRFEKFSDLPEQAKILDSLKALDSFSPSEFAQYAKEHPPDQFSFPTLKHILAPYLAANLGLLSGFDRQTRILGLELYSYLQRLDREIDIAWWFLEKSLEPSIMAENSDIVRKNINATLSFISDMVFRSVQLIEALQKQMNT